MKRWSYSLLLLIILSCTLKMSVIAETHTIKVNLDVDYTKCIFQITWENKEVIPQIEVVSQEGVSYGSKSTPEGTTIEAGRATIYIGEAKKGTWQVVIDGDNLGKVDISGGQMPGNIEIEHFNVTKVGREYSAAWKVTDCSPKVDITIYAARSNAEFNGEVVASFNGDAIGEKKFSLEGLENGNYYFYIQVKEPELGTVNRAFAKTQFYFMDENTPGKLTEIEMHVLDRSIVMNWNSGEYQRFKAMFFEPDTGALIGEEIIEEDNRCSWELPDDLSNVKAAVAVFEGEQLGQYEIYDLKYEEITNAKVVFQEGDKTNMRTIKVSVNFDGDFTVSASLNGKTMIEDSKKDGDYRIDMEDGENKIIFILMNEKGNMKSFIKELYVDSTPPQLSIKNDINNTKTSEPYVYLEGYSEQGSTLSCNELEVEMVNGYFSICCELSPGKNQIMLLSKDVVGNEAVYHAEVEYLFLKSYIHFIIAGIILLVIIVMFSIIYIKEMRRRKRKSEKK